MKAMKKEITCKDLTENSCKSRVKVKITYKTLEMDEPEEYEGTFQRDPSDGSIYLIDLGPVLEPAMKGPVKALKDLTNSALKWSIEK